MAEATRIQGGRKGTGWGYPLMMNSSTPIQFLITPEEVLIINAYNETRHIYTDGRGHPPADDLWPTVSGNSIGHWEGDTLVIDTIMVTNPNEFFQGGPPLSEEAHYSERIWLDGDTLRAEMTIEDPATLSAPWKATELGPRRRLRPDGPGRLEQRPHRLRRRQQHDRAAQGRARRMSRADDF